jgi:hypothetical protein
MLSFLATACRLDPDPASVALSTGPSSFAAGANFLPTPILLTPFADARCGFGSAFAASFRLVVTAGRRDLRMDRLTLQLLDGTSLGGPSVTIPSFEFATQRASLLIPAGTTRDFPVRADFGCFARRPFSLRGNVFLFDGFGLAQTIVLESRIEQR